MPLIAMNREMGSLGKDVAKGLSEALGLKLQHHEIVDHLANRARVRKSHVISFLEGTQGLFERLTVDNLKLRILTADEIMSAAEANEGGKLRDVAIMHHVRAALRTHASTSHCYVKVTPLYGRVTLEGVVDDTAQRLACAEIASRIKGVMDVDNRLRTADMPTRRGASI